MKAKTMISRLYYTANLTRALKGSDSLICKTDDDGTIYVSNGNILVKLNPAEYDDLIRPLSQRDAGNWFLSGGREQVGRNVLDLSKYFYDHASEARHTLTRAPFIFEIGPKDKRTMTAYHNAEKNFSVFVNTAYAGIAADSLPRKSSGGATAPVVIFNDDDPLAMILPIRPDKNGGLVRSIRAYFTDEAAELAQAQADAAAALKRAEEAETGSGALAEQVFKLHDEIDRLTAELAQARQAPAQEQAQDETPQDEHTAPDKLDAIRAQLATLPGIETTTKGAQTAAPVLWITGGPVDEHKAEIESMGGKWSHKRSAYYFRIA